MNRPPTQGKILLMIVVAHPILYLDLFFLLCGFVAANLHWCRRLRSEGC